MEELWEVKVKVLWRMYRHRYIGGRHTDVNNLRKGFPKDKYDVVQDAIDELVKDGFLTLKPTKSGMHVSINLRRIAEVVKVIKTFEKIYSCENLVVFSAFYRSLAFFTRTNIPAEKHDKNLLWLGKSTPPT